MLDDCLGISWQTLGLMNARPPLSKREIGHLGYGPLSPFRVSVLPSRRMTKITKGRANTKRQRIVSVPVGDMPSVVSAEESTEQPKLTSTEGPSEDPPQPYTVTSIFKVPGDFSFLGT